MRRRGMIHCFILLLTVGIPSPELPALEQSGHEPHLQQQKPHDGHRCRDIDIEFELRGMRSGFVNFVLIKLRKAIGVRHR